MYLHNHPSTSTFSMADIDTFITQACIGLMSVVTNQGEVYILHKLHAQTSTLWTLCAALTET